MTRSRKRGRPPHDDVLTPAEWRIADAIRHGMSNASIARRRAISRDAVKFHLANILGKLGLADRQSLKHWPGRPKSGGAASRETSMQTSAGQSFGAIGQIARSVTDIAAAERWYRDVLGLTHLYTFGTLAFFDCGGTRRRQASSTSASPTSRKATMRCGPVASPSSAHRT